MSKPISCGVVFYSKDKNEILMCHPTNQTDFWDLPKGKMEEGETPKEAAIREVEEETSIIIDKNDYMIDLGQHTYNRSKHIHLFVIIDKKIKIEELYCRSMIDNFSIETPECDDYMFIDVEKSLDFMAPSMKRVFTYYVEPYLKTLNN